MATTENLNPEPSLPKERKQKHLPPKSYVDATEENLDRLPHQHASVPELYAGQGENEGHRSPRRNLQKKSSRVNGLSKEKHESHVIIERYQDKDGERLVSIKTEWDDQRGKRMPLRRNSELVSGRKAGARWEKSQCASIRADDLFSELTWLLAFTSHHYQFHSNVASRLLSF